MSFVSTLMEGNKGAFHPATQTPMQKLTLRFVIVGLVYYAFAAIEVAYGWPAIGDLWVK